MTVKSKQERERQGRVLTKEGEERDEDREKRGEEIDKWTMRKN